MHAGQQVHDEGGLEERIRKEGAGEEGVGKEVAEKVISYFLLWHVISH